MDTGSKSAQQEHWQKVYASQPAEKLGWYEALPEKSLELIDLCQLEKNDLIIDVGSGSSTLIDALIAKGFENIVAADISRDALDQSRKRLDRAAVGKVRWLEDDITDSKKIINLSEVSLWHDRAVLHFLTETRQKEAYRALMNKILKKNGYVIISTFSLQGAEKCSGLNVVRYDHRALSEFMGHSYELIEFFDYTHFQPSGNPRPFIYTLFRKKNNKSKLG